MSKQKADEEVMDNCVYAVSLVIETQEEHAEVCRMISRRVSRSFPIPESMTKCRYDLEDEFWSVFDGVGLILTEALEHGYYVTPLQQDMERLKTDFCLETSKCDRSLDRISFIIKNS